ncbi:hypothetical protein GCM10010336_47840 [Streptomyces goshikiensis]|nr:hypothetical protein GCM10010336_47840 [Streptomyces goshikiensis]
MRFGAFAEDVAVGVRVLLRRFGHGGLSRFGGAGRCAVARGAGRAAGRGLRPWPIVVAVPGGTRGTCGTSPPPLHAPSYKYSPASLG